MSKFIDMCDVIGISHDETPSKIKRACKKALSASHPDKGGTESQFVIIQEAYNYLKLHSYTAPSNITKPNTFTAIRRGFRWYIVMNLLDTLRQNKVQIKDDIYIVPAGVRDNDEFIIDDSGHSSTINIIVTDHDRFGRHGDDLIMTVRIPITTAMVGTTISIPIDELSVDEVYIPPMVETSGYVRLSGLGFTNRSTQEVGDMKVYVKTYIPTLTDEQRECIIDVFPTKFTI